MDVSLFKTIFEHGVVESLFVIIMIMIIFGIKKVVSELMHIIPDAINRHFSEIDEMRREYTTSIKDITDKFVSQLELIGHNQDRQYKKLEEIHKDILVLKEKNKG